MPGFLEIALVAVVAFVVLGPRQRLPQSARDRQRAFWAWGVTILLPVLAVGAAGLEQALPPATIARLALSSSLATVVVVTIVDRIRARGR